jgi:hypothetical protein
MLFIVWLYEVLFNCVRIVDVEVVFAVVEVDVVEFFVVVIDIVDTVVVFVVVDKDVTCPCAICMIPIAKRMMNIEINSIFININVEELYNL